MKTKYLTFTMRILVFLVLISGCKKEQEDLPEPILPQFSIGESYGGGIVFYVDDSGKHGLIVSENNQSTSAEWFNGTYIDTPAKGTVVGTGNENTVAITKVQGAGIYAASICENLELNGYSDWFLPSKDELNLLYLQKAAGLIAAFDNNFYWSSTEDSYNGAWSQSFTSGANSSATKDGAYFVRAIRFF